MQAFKTRAFARWANGEHLGDDTLAFAVSEMQRGLIDARLGGHIVKKRIALAGRGKRGSTRTIVAFQQGEKAFFIYGFAKNERVDISVKELQSLKLLARQLLGYSPAALTKAVEAGELIKLEVQDGKEDSEHNS